MVYFERITKIHGKCASEFLREILYDNRNMSKYVESPRQCEEILAKLSETSNQTMLETGVLNLWALSVRSGGSGGSNGSASGSIPWAPLLKQQLVSVVRSRNVVPGATRGWKGAETCISRPTRGSSGAQQPSLLPYPSPINP